MNNLTDRFSRRLDYLRVSVTDKCNLRCVYCVPPAGVSYLSHDEVLRNEEFLHFMGIFVDLGVRKIRFTGGEPLVRRGFAELVSETARRFPGVELCLTTNAVLLDGYVDVLRDCGLRKVNVSLDSLDRRRYAAITGYDELDRVLKNLDMMIDSGRFDVKVNAVLLPETLEEIDSMLDYFSGRNVVLRFIERMPFGSSRSGERFVTSDEITARLARRGALERTVFNDTTVAEMFTLHYRGSYHIKIGVIPSLSHKFCSRCNRLRLTCDGHLRTCLLSNVEYDIKTPYRMDMGDDAIRNVILRAVSEKKREHAVDCSRDEEGCGAIMAGRGMQKIGG